jgi:hypothetical protein
MGARKLGANRPEIFFLLAAIFAIDVAGLSVGLARAMSSGSCDLAGNDDELDLGCELLHLRYPSACDPPPACSVPV